MNCTWDIFLMKKLMKSEVCGSREQYKGPVGVHYSQEKVNNHGLKKKKKKRKKDRKTLKTQTQVHPYPNHTLIL